MRLAIVEKGVPFDVAMAAADWWVLGTYIAIGENQGTSVWNWHSWTWDKRNV